MQSYHLTRTGIATTRNRKENRSTKIWRKCCKRSNTGLSCLLSSIVFKISCSCVHPTPLKNLVITRWAPNIDGKRYMPLPDVVRERVYVDFLTSLYSAVTFVKTLHRTSSSNPRIRQLPYTMLETPILQAVVTTTIDLE